MKESANMKVKILDSFSDKLVNQVEFIAQDKPKAAQKFRKDVIKILKIGFFHALQV